MSERILSANNINVNEFPLTSIKYNKFSLVPQRPYPQSFSDQINSFIDDVKDDCIDIGALIQIAISHFGNKLNQAISEEISPESIYTEDTLTEYAESVGYYHPSEHGVFSS